MTEKKYTEQELVAGLKASDNDAWHYLYDKYKGALLHIISQIITDEEIAVDVLQETLVTVWKNIDKYDSSKGKLFTWLLRLTRNAAINKTRSKVFKSQAKNVDIGDYVYYLEEKNQHNINVDAIGLRKQLMLLREDYRNVLELSYFKGFTQEEVSQALDIPLGTAKTRLRAALIELRKYFV